VAGRQGRPAGRAFTWGRGGRRPGPGGSEAAVVPSITLRAQAERATIERATKRGRARKDSGAVIGRHDGG
jgi:hypothetical protein